MKYYSEMLKEVFDTEKECQEAEALYLEGYEDDPDCDCVKPCDECEESKGCKKSDEVKTPSKKDLADKVQKCEEKVTEARALYSVALEKAKEISKKYHEDIDNLLNPAKKAVQDAEQNKYKALKEFNDAYGVYRVSYSDKKAAEEFDRAIKEFNSTNRWFNEFFWL
jgi:hypothetical protein